MVSNVIYYLPDLCLLSYCKAPPLPTPPKTWNVGLAKESLMEGFGPSTLIPIFFVRKNSWAVGRFTSPLEMFCMSHNHLQDTHCWHRFLIYLEALYI